MGASPAVETATGQPINPQQDVRFSSHRPNPQGAFAMHDTALRNSHAGRRWMVLAAAVATFGTGAVAAQEGWPEEAIGWTSDFEWLLGRAVEQVETSARSADPERRVNAMELCEFLGPPRAEPLLAAGIEDPIVPVRFCAVVNAARLDLQGQLPRIRALAETASPYERAAIIFALHLMGDHVEITPLAAMLGSDDPGLRGTSAMLLGMMGDGTAIPMLRDLAKVPLPSTVQPVRGMIVRMQIAEARVRLGDDSTYNAIRWGLYSRYQEVRVLAATMIGRLGDQKMEEALFDILQDDRQPQELRMATVDALMRISFDRVEVVGETLESLDVVLGAATSENSILRAMAAQTFGSVEAARLHCAAIVRRMDSPPTRYVSGLLHKHDGAVTLQRLLEDPAENVRIAAAAGFLTLARSAGVELP